jgi:hypothetical protein
MKIRSRGRFSSSMRTLYDPKRPRATKTRIENQRKNCGPQLWTSVCNFGSNAVFLRTVQFFSRIRGLCCSKLAQIWTRRGQLLVEYFHLLKDHLYIQETLDFSSLNCIEILLNFYGPSFDSLMCWEPFPPLLRVRIHGEGPEDQREHSQLP